jgi:hypothetical protein
VSIGLGTLIKQGTSQDSANGRALILVQHWRDELTRTAAAH